MHRIALFALLVSGISPAAAASASPCPTERDKVDFIFGPPRVATSPQRLSSLVEPNAVIATEMQILDPVLQMTDRDIEIARPVPVSFPAGQMIGRMVVDGNVRTCVYWGMRVFEPPRDDEGRSFPTICLEDADGDGQDDSLRFFAYKATTGKGIVEVAIPPVRLYPVTPGSNPDKAFVRVYRRLRVAAVEEGHAVLVSDYALEGPGSVGSPDYAPGEDGVITLQLQEGNAQAAGLTLSLVSIGDSWSVTPAGHFAPWIRFRCEGAAIAFGAAR